MEPIIRTEFWHRAQVVHGLWFFCQRPRWQNWHIIHGKNVKMVYCEETRWNKMERLLKRLDKILITSSNYKLELENKSSMWTEVIL